MNDTEAQRYIEAELWTLHEAAYLLRDQLPRSKDEFKVEMHSGSEVALTYRALKDSTRAGTLIFIRADAPDTLMGRLISPGDALTWAKSRDIPIPPILQALTKRRTTRQAQVSAEVDRPVKRRVLVDNWVKHWPSIERDLKDASKNGLNTAKAKDVGFWHENAASRWAEARGKLKSEAATPSWPATKTLRHRLK